MTRKPKPLEPQRRGGRTTGLSPEDRALWERVAESIERLPPQKSRGRIPVKATEAGTNGAGPRPEPVTAPVESREVVKGRAVVLPVPPPSPKGPPPLSEFDRRRARGIATGRVAIDAKLDLHGMTQDAAFHRLGGFLRDCAARGLSTVLVVTGKGGVRPSNGATEIGYSTPERGVLRRNVPLWLEQPELRALVASFRPAGIRHGGDGAFYIHLRRRRGSP
jgi:DNA-nicking Smr family endonuclease